MLVAAFWAKAEKIFNHHSDQFKATSLTGEQQCENISDFLVDMDALASEWYNCREDIMPDFKELLLTELDKEEDGMAEEAKFKVYRDAWNKLVNEVLNEKTSWGKEELKKRMNEVLIACMEDYL